MTKLNRIILITVIIFLPLIVSFVFYEKIFLDINYDLKEVQQDDFSGIENLKLKGEVIEVISDVGRAYHGTGIIKVNIISSNINFYDPRDYQANYFCIINENKAEIYSNIPYGTDVGDIIQIDILNDQAFVINKDDGKKKRIGLSIYQRYFFDYISQKNYQKI